ncbi:SMP-30/gluconolactonase/LRE family protein [Microbulbifer sp. ALW1]|uniref:SMP-30/gluconolactonase/LRE family protein n=1 Tax=Microbulbifer sp. (strain ALW1) TaxID=1516059 RepID=UPI00135CBCCE|nr:SMP-30/gluconolactonase/LRE family protein [Microbulbifer sp. ALW1]
MDSSKKITTASNSVKNIAQDRVHCVWDAGATLGEGPCWVAREQAIYWVDINQFQLHRLCTVTDQRRSWHIADQITALAPRRNGGFIATLRDGFALLEIPQLGDRVHIKKLGGPEKDLAGNRFNDGKADSKGRFWAGSMDDSELNPTGALYRLDSDCRWLKMDDHYIITNGPAFSPDGHTLYHTDTLGKVIYAFDLTADGRIGNKREFFRFDGSSGFPDGMTVDEEGCLWVCHFAGWGITRISPRGNIVGRIELPVANVTSCTFAGDKLDTLYITTARKGLNHEQLAQQPLAGGLFRVEPGVRGIAPGIFSG